MWTQAKMQQVYTCTNGICHNISSGKVKGHNGPARIIQYSIICAVTYGHTYCVFFLSQPGLTEHLMISWRLIYICIVEYYICPVIVVWTYCIFSLTNWPDWSSSWMSEVSGLCTFIKTTFSNKSRLTLTTFSVSQPGCPHVHWNSSVLLMEESDCWRHWRLCVIASHRHPTVCHLTSMTEV